MHVFAWFKWQALFSDWHVLALGLGQTALAAVMALALSLVLGIIFGVMGTAPWGWAKVVNRVYVELYQNTPLVTQIIFLYYGLPHVKIVLPVLWVGVLGVGLYHGAYMSEAVRAGIQAVHRGQLEAAISQGFSYLGAMRHIIVPQALQVVLPPLTNQMVSLIKNTSILTMFSGGDLMFQVDAWAADSGYYGPAYVVAGLLYWLLCFPLTRVAARLEARNSHSRREVQAA